MKPYLQRLPRTLRSALTPVLLPSLVALALGAPVALAQAQDYPNRPVNLVVPFPPGGNTDTTARLLSQCMGEQMGQTVVVENVGGAGGSIGASRVAAAAPDGYTLLFGTAGTQAVNLSLFKQMSEKNLDDFEYIALVASVPNVLVVSADTPVNTVAELLELAKTKEGGLSYGSPGSGSTIHLSGEMLRAATKLPLLHVPYRGSAPALTDLMGGQIDFIIENITPAMPHIKAGKLKALAIADAQRSPMLPDVPTMIESGFADFVTGTWNGVLAPKGTPAAVLDRVAQATLHCAQQSAFTDPVKNMGGQPLAVQGQEFRSFTEKEYQRWNRAITDAGVEKQ